MQIQKHILVTEAANKVLLISCRLYLSLCLFVCVFASTCGAQSNSKSIRRLSENAYLLRSMDSSRSFAMQFKALGMARAIKAQQNMVECYALLSITYRRKLDVAHMQLYADSAILLARQLGTAKALAYAYMAKGYFESYIDENGASVTDFLEALNHFEKTNNYTYSSAVLAEIAYCYSGTDEDKYKKYAILAVDRAMAHGRPDDILKARLAMGGYLFTYKKIPDDSLNTAGNYLKNTIDYVEKHKRSFYYKSNVAIAYLNLANQYQVVSGVKYESIYLPLLDSAIDISTKNGHNNIMCNAMGMKGTYFLQHKNYAAAEKLFKDGIALQHTLPYVDNRTYTLFYTSLKELSILKQNYKQYYEYDTVFERYRNLMYNEASLKASQNADARYESSLKNSTISLLEKENKLQRNNKWMGYGAAILLGIVLLLMFRSYYYKQKYFIQTQNTLKEQQKTTELQLQIQQQESMEALEQKLNMERRLLQYQMDPHFMFNALGNIQSFILQNDTKNAVGYLSRFSILMRQILEQSKKNSIELKEEIKSLENYIELQKLRLNSSFDYSFRINKNVSDNISIPPMLIQPLVENAIEHGLKPLNGLRKGYLEIIFSPGKDDDTIICIVKDNGIGIEQSKAQKQYSVSAYQSMALDITKERLKKWNTSNENLALMALELKDKNNQAIGSSATIILPKILF